MVEELKQKLMATKPPHSEEEIKLIQRAYRTLLSSIKSEIKKEDKENIRRAYEMAVEAHRKQRRKSGEPYILHPIEVARICAEEIGLGPTAIICALLHDVVEDTDITLQEIEEEFGAKIAMIVDGLTKFKEFTNSTSPQAENFKKVLTTLVKDVRVVLVKMADRLHNMRTLAAMPPHKQLKIASETSYIYAPLAHRLGLYAFKTEYEDLCMKILEPENYRWVAKKLQETKKSRNAYIDKFLEPIQGKLKKAGIEATVYGRPKSIHSIWNKVKNKKVEFEEIYDLFAIRIILDVPVEDEKAKCWEVYTIVTETNQPIPARLKDWISTPKANGYESLHTTVIGPEGKYVEVQIRSQRMHEIAEKGYAAHWKYKGVKEGALDVFSVWLDTVRDSLENPSNDPVEFLQDFKTNLFKEEIYVFTPKGDMIMLPSGATALDFAFNIHSEVGYHCRAVKVNNQLVPLGHQLKSGDQVSVVTSKSQKPSENWLNYVVTGKARSKIRASMKEEHRLMSQLGKETLMRKMKNIKADFEKNADMLVRYFNYKSRPDLYAGIYQEEINIQKELKKFTVEGGKLIEVRETPAKLAPKKEIDTKPNVAKSSDTKASSQFVGKPELMIDDKPASGLEYSLATCCNPVQGDAVFAYIATNGMKVHRNTCNNAEHLIANYAYRILRAEWVDTARKGFQVKLALSGIDGQGMAQKIMDIISNQQHLNMRSISLDGNQGFFQGAITLMVKNVEEMEAAMKALKAVDGIYSVIREE